jgi:hypothetical protein
MFLGTASENLYDRGRATDWARGCQSLPNPDKLRMLSYITGSEAVGAKVHGREGNNPDYQLRSPMYVKLIKRGLNAMTARMLAWKQPFI